MPIPPRPIPTSGRTAHRPNQAHRSSPRPGAAVPRKSLPLTSSLDWRAEVALLNELGPGSAGKGARSVPVSSKIGSKVKEKEKEVEGKREVGLEGLILDGRGKREKRATTATTLGFDFIPNPSVLALPDTSPFPNNPKPSSLLTTSKSITSGSNRPSPAIAAASASPLAGTPMTPGLLARSTSDAEDEEDDDGWEHVQLDSTEREMDDENVNSDGEEDVIVLGDLELELEEDMQQLGLGETNDKSPLGSKSRGKREGKSTKETVSYAAALGA
ncbi:hypothetical protein CI109_104005 [Kwoniella shandongensis]|uniref:Uncharacterized protein n=1 Tax=Kwoniella shandongensis TaxID=1734106 RepID=A0A5M6BYV6_9TREE|nr:uncharacterized protein CI109_004110 [Kwoniella shandongensis]KAA5527571.1 hypothetical protein CI109_004110 [Kwoniella shandongensis]